MYFWPIFDLFYPNPSGPTFDLFLAYFNYFGVSGPLGRPQIHNPSPKFWMEPGEITPKIPKKKNFCQNSLNRGQSRKKSDLVNFRGPDWRKFSELCVFAVMLPKSRFGKPIFGHSAGSTKLDRPYCKRFWFCYFQNILGGISWGLNFGPGYFLFSAISPRAARIARHVTRHFPYRPPNHRKFKDTKNWLESYFQAPGQSDSRVTQKWRKRSKK